MRVLLDENLPHTLDDFSMSQLKSSLLDIRGGKGRRTGNSFVWPPMNLMYSSQWMEAFRINKT